MFSKFLLKLLLAICCFFWLSSVPGFASTATLEIEVDLPELRKTLSTALALPDTLTSAQGPDRPRLHAYQQQLPRRVAEALQPLGYFATQTSSQVVQTTDGPVIRVQVHSGEAIRIARLDLRLMGPGADNEDVAKLLRQFPLNLDDVLRQDLYEQGKALLLEGMISLGFLDAHFSVHRLHVSLQQYQAEISLELETGRRYLFGPTSFNATGGYSQQFLQRFLGHHEGEIFSHEKLAQTQLNLLNSDLFRGVSVIPQPKQVMDGRIPITIELQPAPGHRWRPGIGYGTNTGARVSLRYHDLRLLGNGNELQGELLAAEYRQSLLTSFIIPNQNRLDSRTRLQLGYDREESDSYLSRKLYTEVEYQRAHDNHLLGALFVRLSRETSEVGDEQTRTRMLLPGLRLQWHDTDKGSTSQAGVYGSFELKGSHADLFSDTSLAQLSGLVTAQRPLTKTILALIRLQGGTTWHADPLRELPASLRFFAGGVRSVRGYGYQTLGPKDAAGQVIGGNHLLVGNFELEKRLTDKWGSAIFYDLGNAFNTFSDYELAQGAGIGARRYTPIGPIRIDLARRIGQSKPRWRLHLSMGFDW